MQARRGLGVLAVFGVAFGLFVPLAAVAEMPQDAPGVRSGELPQVVEGMGFRVSCTSTGKRAVGSNDLTLSVKNESNGEGRFCVSVRTEGSAGWQRSYYFSISLGEEKALTAPYEVPDRGYRLLRIQFGVPDQMPSDENPHPKWKAFAKLSLLTATTSCWLSGQPGFSFWTFEDDIKTRKARILDAAQRPAPEDDAKRQELKRILEWDRRVEGDFEPTVVGEETIGDVTVATMRINGEPGIPIVFLVMRQAGAAGPLKTIVFLTPNPPGKKEIGMSLMVDAVHAGFQVVSIDRRHRDSDMMRKETGRPVAGPVFDCRRVIDYLITQPDVASGSVAIVGFSGGAIEGQYLAALHESVCAAVLACGPIENDYLFRSAAWLPTMYDAQVVREIGGAEYLGRDLADVDFAQQMYALGVAPELNWRALQAFRERYKSFHLANSTNVLPLAAPKPLLVIAGARDPQFPIDGVLALDGVLRSKYASMGVEEASGLYVTPRAVHEYTPASVDVTIDWLRKWM